MWLSPIAARAATTDICHIEETSARNLSNASLCRRLRARVAAGISTRPNPHADRDRISARRAQRSSMLMAETVTLMTEPIVAVRPDAPRTLKNPSELSDWLTREGRFLPDNHALFSGFCE